MATADKLALKDIAVLTQSMEFVVRKLIKILVGKISLVRLQEMIESIFVEEVEIHLRERPDSDVPLTALAVVTGLDTRKLTQIRSAKTYGRPKHTTRRFLDEITPESCVIDLWTSNPRFTEPGTSEPRILDIWGREGSFEILVKEAVRSRGITVTSVIERMVHNEQVTVHDGKLIELTATEFAPKHLRQQIGEIKLGLDAAGHLLGTVDRNLRADQSGARKFFQRGSWTHRLQPHKREDLEVAARVLLTKADNEARTLLESFEGDIAKDGQLTAGVGFYYFEAEEF